MTAGCSGYSVYSAHTFVSRPLENAHFFYPTRPFNPEYENVQLALNRCNFACLDLKHKTNIIIPVKVFLPDLTRSHKAHNTYFTDDRRRERERQTNDNRTNSSTVT